MQKLDVWFKGWGQSWPLGTLAQNAQHLLFEYSAEALQRGVKFSELSVPLRAHTYSGLPAFLGGLPGFVADALPDGWGLLLMDRVVRQAGRDPATLTALDRLGFIGDRAMGALAFQPAHDGPLTQDDLTLQQLAQAAHQVVHDRDTQALQTLAVLGGSPHGARPKALVQFDPVERTVSTAPDGPGQPWLIKFPAQHEHTEVSGIEWAYAQLARRAGVEMPDTHHFKISPRLAAFGVQRFDRANGLRVPVQSFAAALHVDFRLPALDYQTLLQATRYLTGSQPEVLKAYRRCVFNVVLNNRDDHAKNFALRMNPRMEWELAPAYDLSFNIGPGGYHQTAVMGEAANPGREHLLRLARECGVPEAHARQSTGAVCDAAQHLEAVLDAAGVRKATRKVIGEKVRGNVGRCAR